MNAQRKNNRVLAVLTLVLLVIIFLEPQFGWKLRAIFTPQSEATGDTAALSAENETLKAELAKLSVVNAELPAVGKNEIHAMVYSRYPFNFKNQLLIDAGVNEGVATGSVVTFQGIFVGQVISAFSDYSVVQTVFDTRTKIPVRIGNGGYDGLLQGGADPSIGSIAATAPIHAGDVVYSAGAGIPYGLPLAEIAGTSTSPDSLFEEAKLTFTYDVNDIQTVAVLP